MLNGITPALRTTVHELCGSEHVVEAMAYIDGKGPRNLSFNLGRKETFSNTE